MKSERGKIIGFGQSTISSLKVFMLQKMDVYLHMCLVAPEQEMDLWWSSRSHTSFRCRLVFNSECEVSGGTWPDFQRLNNGLLSVTYQRNTGYFLVLFYEKVHWARGLHAAQGRLPPPSKSHARWTGISNMLYSNHMCGKMNGRKDTTMSTEVSG